MDFVLKLFGTVFLFGILLIVVCAIGAYLMAGWSIIENYVKAKSVEKELAETRELLAMAITEIAQKNAEIEALKQGRGYRRPSAPGAN